jgi:LmbE family N-acetylglucosaminyl deacetylase
MRTHLAFLLCGPLLAFDPLPEDRGAAGAHQAIRRLQTSARVLYVTAHPDDEDGATITWLSRGLGAQVTLLSLTRGESGANLMTGDFFDSLGVLRTRELSRAARYYHCRLRFTSFVDYGYSKNIEEAWRNWDRRQLLQEVVRIVREEDPHVILARWQGTPRDGHGHHSAAGDIARAAFDAVNDGRLRKLYSNNRGENDPWTVKVDAGIYDPMLGRTYAQIARDGLSEQRTQGAGAVVSRPGPSVAYYLRTGSKIDATEKEATFFDGLDVAPPPALATHSSEALRLFRADRPQDAAPAIAAGLKLAKDPATAALWQEALNRVLALQLEALALPERPLPEPMSRFRPYETFAVATPGQEFRVGTRFHNQSGAAVTLERVDLVAGPGWTIQRDETGFRVRVSAAVADSSVFWNRDSVKDSRYRYASDWGTALPKPPLTARAVYRYQGVEGVLETEVLVSRIDEHGVQRLRPIAVGPALAVRFTSAFGILPAGRDSYRLNVAVRNVAAGPRKATLRLLLPAGWTAQPERAPISFGKEGEETAVRFTLKPGAGSETVISAVAESAGTQYTASFEPRAYGTLDPLYEARAARHTVRRVDVKVRDGLRVGYIMGTGDDVPAALDQLGVAYDLLDAAALASGDLSKYTAIVAGIRAWAARADIRTYNQRLLDYASAGGVVIVQYNTPEYDNNYGPAPYTMGRNPEEVSEEDSPVTILDPGDPAFEAPNRIVPADFDGWVEQRGSKFFATWDPNWKPLLETHDTGQAPQKGGWLVARHGKGLYVYCAYAWYRQLPFAVPGAVRLFANLISLRP